MSDLGTLMRRLARASGFLALFAVVLFATVGVVMLRIAHAPASPNLTAPVMAGTPVDGPGTSVNIWGADVTDAAAVTCTWLTPEVIPATLTLADEHVVADDPAMGTVTLVGSIIASEDRTFTCTGGGMTSFAIGSRDPGPPPAAVGIGFLVGAGIAGLWAALMLTVTRPRHPAHP